MKIAVLTLVLIFTLPVYAKGGGGGGHASAGHASSSHASSGHGESHSSSSSHAEGKSSSSPSKSTTVKPAGYSWYRPWTWGGNSCTQEKKDRKEC